MASARAMLRWGEQHAPLECTQCHPLEDWCPQDPFALLVGLFAALLSPGEQNSGLTSTTLSMQAAVLELLTAALYPAVAGQAVMLCSGSQRRPAEVAASMAASATLARALESAADSQLSVFLERAALLLQLLHDRPSPSQAAQGGALRQRLHLPSLITALQSPAAATLLPPQGSRLMAVGSLELNLIIDRQRWTVCSLFEAQPAKLMDLPASYQVGAHSRVLPSFPSEVSSPFIWLLMRCRNGTCCLATAHARCATRGPRSPLCVFGAAPSCAAAAQHA